MRKMFAVLAVALVIATVFAVLSGSSDKEKLQGTWVLTSTSNEGRESPAPNMGQPVVVTFKGDKLISSDDDKDKESTFTIDADKSPKQINVTIGKDTQEGIYLLDGEMLRIGLALKGRPTSFEGKGVQTLTFLRKKS